jgi:hypothetical protein
MNPCAYTFSLSSILALVSKLKDGPQASRAFEDALSYTFEEIQKVLPNIATKNDAETTLRARVGLVALTFVCAS